MPIAGEVFAWPETLPGDLPRGPWLVVHCKPRQEKLLASNLRRSGISGLLFYERRVHRYKGKGEQTSLVPLLPGYLFAVGDEYQLDAIYGTDRVVRIMPERRPELLHQELTDLIALVATVTTGARLVVRPELVPGVRVTLRRGALAGLSGVIERRRGLCQIVVNLHALGHAVAVTCSAEDVDNSLAEQESQTTA